MSNHRNTSKELRDLGLFSGSDLFMRGGHQIINRNLANARAKRKAAPWATNDDEVQKILLRAFPKLARDEKQRKRAGRWLRIIHLFYRSGMSSGEVAAELKETPYRIRDTLRGIRHVAAGGRYDRSCAGRKRG